jgi:predicted ArsR family transcriptional regulator
MPISKKVFLKGDFKAKYTDRSKHPITLLLSKNNNLAYTVKEIVKIVRMNKNTVRGMLRALEKEEKILHKTPYYAWRVIRKGTLTKKKR